MLAAFIGMLHLSSISGVGPSSKEVRVSGSTLGVQSSSWVRVFGVALLVRWLMTWSSVSKGSC